MKTLKIFEDGKEVFSSDLDKVSAETLENHKKSAPAPEREVRLWDVYVKDDVVGVVDFVSKGVSLPCYIRWFDGASVWYSAETIRTFSYLGNAADLFGAMMKPLKEGMDCKGAEDLWYWERNSSGYYLSSFYFGKADDNPAILRSIAATVMVLANEAEKERECKS